ncbi:MAG: phosphatase PAP2 family protein [Lachnospiraceae bacterium]|nr:phosphatase PAP2 family protein [Lachnospiraceae bacterium]
MIKYRKFIIVTFFPIYMAWFMWLERRTDVDFHMIHCRLDDMIPFNEYFIIPYLMWFGYVVLVLALLAIKPKGIDKWDREKHDHNFFMHQHINDFYKLAAILMMGMITCLFIYTVFPNRIDLRPEFLENKDPFTAAIIRLYLTDTPTNVCPSIHVYNSLCVTYALCSSHSAAHLNTVPKRVLQGLSWALCILICLSTLFIKQHSVVDIFFACLLYAFYYVIVYRILYRKVK